MILSTEKLREKLPQLLMAMKQACHVDNRACITSAIKAFIWNGMYHAPEGNAVDGFTQRLLREDAKNAEGRYALKKSVHE